MMESCSGTQGAAQGVGGETSCDSSWQPINNLTLSLHQIGQIKLVKSVVGLKLQQLT